MRYSQGRRRRCGPGSSPGRTSGTAPWVLYVHDVVRELFEAESLHRAPAAYTQLHRDVRSYFMDRIRDPAEPHPERAAAEVLLMQRRTPLAAETSILRDRGLLSVPRASPAACEEIIA